MFIQSDSTSLISISLTAPPLRLALQLTAARRPRRFQTVNCGPMARTPDPTDDSPVYMVNLEPEIKELRTELPAAFVRVLDSVCFIQGNALRGLEAEFAAYLGVKHAVGLNSGTDALIIGLRTLGVGPGDEVITSPFTFFASAESIALVGATPVFVDIEYDSFNLDPKMVAAAITPRTKAIMPVHLYGRSARMQPLIDLADEHGLGIIEDNAQAIEARSPDLPGNPCTGTAGDIVALSSYPTKNLGAYGDAGMTTTNSDELAEQARKLLCHGSLVASPHELLGHNSRLDELQAAILRVKLPHLDSWNDQRRQQAHA